MADLEHGRAVGAANAAFAADVPRFALSAASPLREAYLPMSAGGVARNLGCDAKRARAGQAVPRAGEGSGARAPVDGRLSGLAACARGAG